MEDSDRSNKKITKILFNRKLRFKSILILLVFASALNPVHILKNQNKGVDIMTKENTISVNLKTLNFEVKLSDNESSKKQQIKANFSINSLQLSCKV